MKKITIILGLALGAHCTLTAQNTFPSTGNAGIGTTSPAVRLEVNTGADETGRKIMVSGMTFPYTNNIANGTAAVTSQIGLSSGGGDLGGLTWHNDGGVVGPAFAANQRMLWYGYADANQKYFRLLGAESNFGNHSLEFRNNSPSFVNTNNFWVNQPNNAIIAAWNHGLNIGAWSGLPVKIFSDQGTAGKLADIFVQNSRVGIGTETPNSNAKLDVAGNVFASGKLAIGTTDMAKIGPYALAVNGDAIFNKARVKLFGAWPDYVFGNEYQLLPLARLEQYILEHKHLPDVPSAAEVQRDGIDLGDNQAVLLRKIEELTLYVIQQQKQLDAQQKEISALKQGRQ